MGLVQELQFVASSRGQLAYTVHGKVAAGDIHSPLFTVSETDVFTVIGLYPDHDNRVTVELITHVIGGLSMNDFIMAAKIDRLTEDEGEK